MSYIQRIRNIFFPEPSAAHELKAEILSLKEQANAWRRASGKMRWGIKEEEFERLSQPLPLTADEQAAGFSGTVLFYGFGDDGGGHADAVLSGKLAWDYARKSRKKRTIWQSPHVDFEKPDAFRLRPQAPARPRGFYFAKVHTQFLSMSSVAQALKFFIGVTGWGPEGFQFLCVTHTHFADLMDRRKLPFMALADYEVAPYGFNDFFDVPQLFSSNGILGLGIGNVDQHYAGFAVPAVIILAGK